jgi:hypothetical protein
MFMYPAAPRKGRAERSFQPRVITFIRVIPVLERGVRLRLGGPANQVTQHTVLDITYMHTHIFVIFSF